MIYLNTPRQFEAYTENFDEEFLLEKWFIKNEEYIKGKNGLELKNIFYKTIV